MKSLFILSTLTHFLVRPVDKIHTIFLYSGTIASVLTHMYPNSPQLFFIDLTLAGTWGMYTTVYKNAFLANLFVFLFYCLVESYPTVGYTIGHTVFHLLSARKEYLIVKNEAELYT